MIYTFVLCFLLVWSPRRSFAALQAPQLVKGPGVVGQQPVLEPGQSFEYSSACPITCAPKEGYQVRNEGGARSAGKGLCTIK